jgi:RNA polymerase sigma factor (sigma-70 family)
MPPARLDKILAATTASLRLDPHSDAELLARFLDDRNETAFRTLLVRHTPAVRAACRGWLRASADIDDAAQATFLVLVQRAGSIRDRSALGRWLYRVAANVARRLRQRRMTACPVPEDVPGREPAAYDDLHDLLADEVAQLPEKYRLPVQLCYWAGLTTSETAQRLGWPKGTVLTRLAWARKRLQKRLARRGVSQTILAGSVGAVPAVSGKWVSVTTRAAKGVLAGEAPATMGVSLQTISLTEGVVRAMILDRLKYIALAALVALGLAGYGVRQWVTASDDPGNVRKSPGDPADPRMKDKDPGNPLTLSGGKDTAKGDETKPGATGRRREVVIRLPAGIYIKEVDATPYGSGRLTWTYEEERVLGLIEGSVMGFEFELATEAEYSLSSNGTIYGLVTSFRLNHLRLPDGEQYAELKPYLGLWSAVEPIVNEMVVDLPFSYHFRVQGDRLVISDYRILLAGPNPLGKLGGLAAKDTNNKELMMLSYFQALGTAIEGTYTAADAKENPPSNKRQPIRPRGQMDLKAPK